MERNEMCKSCERNLNSIKLIRIAMIYERLRSGEVHADDYYLCHISDYKQKWSSLPCLTILIFCRNLKKKVNLI